MHISTLVGLIDQLLKLGIYTFPSPCRPGEAVWVPVAAAGNFAAVREEKVHVLQFLNLPINYHQHNLMHTMLFLIISNWIYPCVLHALSCGREHAVASLTMTDSQYYCSLESILYGMSSVQDELQTHVRVDI